MAVEGAQHPFSGARGDTRTSRRHLHPAFMPPERTIPRGVVAVITPHLVRYMRTRASLAFSSNCRRCFNTTHGLIGDNGCGKTNFMRLILKYRPRIWFCMLNVWRLYLKTGSGDRQHPNPADISRGIEIFAVPQAVESMNTPPELYLSAYRR